MTTDNWGRVKLARGDASLFTADDLRKLSNEEVLDLVKRCYAVLDRRSPNKFRLFRIKANEIDSLIGAERRTYGSRKIHTKSLKKLSEVISMVLVHEQEQ